MTCYFSDEISILTQLKNLCNKVLAQQLSKNAINAKKIYHCAQKYERLILVTTMAVRLWVDVTRCLWPCRMTRWLPQGLSAVITNIFFLKKTKKKLTFPLRKRQAEC
jgi:hypothetical protein